MGATVNKVGSDLQHKKTLFKVQENKTINRSENLTHLSRDSNLKLLTNEVIK